MIEYKVVHIDGAMIAGTESNFERELNKLGEQGWIMCNRSTSQIFVFHRVANEEKEV